VRFSHGLRGEIYTDVNDDIFASLVRLEKFSVWESGAALSNKLSYPLIGFSNGLA